MLLDIIKNIANGILNTTLDERLKGFWVAVLVCASINFFGWVIFQGLMRSIIGKTFCDDSMKFFNHVVRMFQKHFLEKHTMKLTTKQSGEMTFEQFIPYPGDICVAADLSLYGKVVAFVESLWTGYSVYNHAFTWVDSTSCVEALVRITHSSKTKYTKRQTRTYRIPLTDTERTAIQVGLLDRVNGAYGFDKYPLFLLDCVTSQIKRILGFKTPCFWFTKTFHINNIPVCSELVVWACDKFTSYRLKNDKGAEVPWVEVSPAYLDQLLKLPINNAFVVYEQEEIK